MQDPLDSHAAVRQLWDAAGLDPAALARLRLSGREPVLPSSVAVGSAAQAAIAAAALAASEVGRLRNGAEQHVSVDKLDAAIECHATFSIDGRVAEIWDKISGLYRSSSAPTRTRPRRGDSRATWWA
jgi:hypothetical protein